MGRSIWKRSDDQTLVRLCLLATLKMQHGNVVLRRSTTSRLAVEYFRPPGYSVKPARLLSTRSAVSTLSSAEIQIRMLLCCILLGVSWRLG
jgi:hypothetical protein